MIFGIIIITTLVSIYCFSNHQAFARLSMRPYDVVHNKQWDKLITHGFVHGSMPHLLINMLVFWSFGAYVFHLFQVRSLAAPGSMDPALTFILLYFGGLIAASLYDVVKYRDNYNFTSVGASGAVSAVVFTSIFYNPIGLVYFFGIIPIPGIVFGLLYIGYETWSARHQRDHINHHAHIFGALYGFIFPMLIGGISEIKIFLNGF